MDARLRVYELRFAETGALSRAFDRVSGSPDVASCSLELAARRIRLLAHPATGEALIERLYLEGGLAWCSRHAYVGPPGA